MKPVAISTSLLLSITLSVFGQSDLRRNSPRAMRSPKAATAAKAKAQKESRSTVGLDFRYLTQDRDGGVWITGTAWFFRGLMVNDRGGRPRAITIPGVSTISHPIFATRDIGWMADGRSLYKTLDQGSSWQRVEIPGQPNIRIVHFTDVHNGWAGGLDRGIYHTSDAGRTWKEQKTGLNYRFLQIFFVDNLNGWAVGWTPLMETAQKQALICTHDGGENWELISNADENSPLVVRPIFFVNANEGWAIDNWSNIVHTVNGGKTWTIQERNDGNSLNSLFFINDREGWASGDGILHTADGGETWNYQRTRKHGENYLDEITFTDRDHGWAIGMDSALRTTDGGKTWQPMPDDWKTMIPSFEMLLDENSRKDVTKRQ